MRAEKIVGVSEQFPSTPESAVRIFTLVCMVWHASKVKARMAFQGAQLKLQACCDVVCFPLALRGTVEGSMRLGPWLVRVLNAEAAHEEHVLAINPGPVGSHLRASSSGLDADAIWYVTFSFSTGCGNDRWLAARSRAAAKDRMADQRSKHRRLFRVQIFPCRLRSTQANVFCRHSYFHANK